MATEPSTPDPQARRASIRRARSGGGGFSSGGSAPRLDSYDGRGTHAEEDEVDNLTDPSAHAPRLPPPAGADDGGNNPRARLQQVQIAGSAGYAKEYRLKLMASMLMRGVGLDVIAQQLQISIHTAERYRAELKDRFREDARQLNIEEMVGSGVALYDELSQMSIRMASSGQGVPPAMKLAAIRTALAANADKTRFLTSTGVYDVLRYKQAEDAGALSDVQALMAQTRALIEGLDDDEPQGAPPPPRRAVRRARPPKQDGFKPMDWDDKDATGSANEMETI